MEFYVGRLMLTGAVTPKDKTLWTALTAGRSVEWYGSKWKIILPRAMSVKLPSGLEKTLFGAHLVKYKDEDEEVFDDITNEVEIQTLKNKFIGSGVFYVDIANSLIAYEMVREISDKSFRDIVCRLVREAFDGFFVGAEIEPILRRKEFIDEIYSFDKINDFFIALHPSNPRYSERWKKVDDELQMTNTDSIYMKGAARGDRSIIIADGSNLLASFYMVADGYGRAAIKGVRDGVRLMLRSASKAFTVIVDEKQGDGVESAIASELDHVQSGIDSGKDI